MDFSAILQVVLTNPAILGMLVSIGVSQAKNLLGQLDATKVLVENSKIVQTAVVVLSGLAAFLSMGAQGHAADANVQGAVDFVTAFLSAQGMHLVGTNVKAAIAKQK